MTVAKCLRVLSLKPIAKFRRTWKSSAGCYLAAKSLILLVHFSVSYLIALLQEPFDDQKCKNVDGKKVDGLSALNCGMPATSSTSACSMRSEGHCLRNQSSWYLVSSNPTWSPYKRRVCLYVRNIKKCMGTLKSLLRLNIVTYIH